MTYLLIYLAGFVLVQVFSWLAFKSEPTAHGKEMGHVLYLIVGLCWPIAVPWLLLVGTTYLLYCGWTKLVSRIP